jgi:hypothetical protein
VIIAVNEAGEEGIAIGMRGEQAVGIAVLPLTPNGFGYSIFKALWGA